MNILTPIHTSKPLNRVWRTSTDGAVVLLCRRVIREFHEALHKHTRRTEPFAPLMRGSGDQTRKLSSRLRTITGEDYWVCVRHLEHYQIGAERLPRR